MDGNVRIAKQLVRLARSLVAVKPVMHFNFSDEKKTVRKYLKRLEDPKDKFDFEVAEEAVGRKTGEGSWIVCKKDENGERKGVHRIVYKYNADDPSKSFFIDTATDNRYSTLDNAILSITKSYHDDADHEPEYGTYEGYSGRIAYAPSGGGAGLANFINITVKDASFEFSNGKNGGRLVFKSGEVTNGSIDLPYGGLEWRGGTFNSEDGYVNDCHWYGGIWKSGGFLYSIWEDGLFKGGEFSHSTWVDGTFEKGEFMNSTWQDGTFEGDEFTGSKWEDGTFEGGKFTDSTWKDGVWKDGEWNSDDSKWKGGYDKDGNWHKSGDAPGQWREYGYDDDWDEYGDGDDDEDDDRL